MIDTRFIAFLGVAFLLVLSPGPTMAVVTEAAVEYGRSAALWTVVGVGVANATLALAAGLGLSMLVGGRPWMLDVVTVAGALYLGYLGGRAIVGAVGGSWGRGEGQSRPGAGPSGPPQIARASSVGKGLATNLLNPSVALFYMTLVPQFIARDDPFAVRFALLCGSHVLLAVTWHSVYAWSLGTVSDRLARPPVRRVMALVTGAVLVGLALRLLGRI